MVLLYSEDDAGQLAVDPIDSRRVASADNVKLAGCRGASGGAGALQDIGVDGLVRAIAMSEANSGPGHDLDTVQCCYSATTAVRCPTVAMRDCIRHGGSGWSN